MAKDMNTKFKKPVEKDIKGPKPKIGTKKETTSAVRHMADKGKLVTDSIKGPGMKMAKTGHSGRHTPSKEGPEMKKVAKAAHKGRW